jgi:hypothetical protein
MCYPSTWLPTLSRPTPSPPPTLSCKEHLHLGFCLPLASGPTCIELARMDVVPGGTRGGLDAHWWSADPPAAPLVPPDPHTRPQTCTRAVIRRPGDLAMALQCPWHLPSPSVSSRQLRDASISLLPISPPPEWWCRGRPFVDLKQQPA